MKILMLILKDPEQTTSVIHHLGEAEIPGGTIIEATGMANALLDMEDLPIFGMLRHLLENEAREESKIMMFILGDKDEIKARQIIKQVIGELDQPNTGIMFSIPIIDVEGLGE